MKIYIAYGSNLHCDQMMHRCPDAIRVGATEIEDYELQFRGNSRGTGVATIEYCKGSSVPVGLWAISDKDEEELDRYEGWPWLYEKKYFPLTVNGIEVSAMAYVMTPGHTITPPSKYYYGVIDEGYRDFGFDPEPLITAAVVSMLANEDA